MEVKSLELVNFKNYTSKKVSFSSGLNVITGKNAIGKTNLMEAILFCAVGKSFRVNKDKDLIKWKSSESSIKLDYKTRIGNKKIQIFLQEKGNKSILINNTPIKKMGELMSQFNVIYFSPDELKIVKDGPSERRRFMDIDISQISKTYFYLLQRYEKILAQRNKLLKNTTSFEVLKETISIWNEQLADIGSKIIVSRNKFVNKLNEYITKIHSELTNNKEKFRIEYSGIISEDIEFIKKKLLNDYDKTLEKDFNLKFTNIGSHRDDLKFFINDIEARVFASQGQQRTVALSLKFAEMEVFKNQTSEMPVLLLDDVLSELDSFRQKALLEKVSQCQTIITCTDLASTNLDLSKKINIIKII